MKSVICIDNHGRNDLILGNRYHILRYGNTGGVDWYKLDEIEPLAIAERFTKYIELNNNIRVI